MKNSKKLIALVLAMVMIFALTASALAATNSADAVDSVDSANSTMTVKVTIKGVIKSPTASNPNATTTVNICNEEEFTITSNSTVYHLVNTMSNLDSDYAHGAVWKTVDLVDDDGNPTGGTAQALTSLSCNKTVNPTATYPNRELYTWSSESKTTQTFEDGAFTSWLFNYEGHNWVYTVNGQTTNKYMDQYVLSNGDSVELTYQYSTENWRQFFTAE